MPHLTQVPQELALDEHTPHRDDLVVLFIYDDERVVGAREAALGVERVLVPCQAGIRGGGEYREDLDMCAVVVGASEGSNLRYLV